MNARATFTRMEDSTAADWAVILPEAIQMARGLPERVMAHLQLLDGDFGGFPVDRLTHCRQAATLAQRDGRSDAYVVCALLHDIGDTLGSYNHPDIAAAILQPFVDDALLWMVKHHGIFQGHNFFHHIGMDRNLRDQFKDHPHAALTEEFVRLYDNPAFDPGMVALPLAHFAPLLRQVMAAPQRSVYQAAMQGKP
jgi:predicted HD phosphohydrolase